jgi:PD-(D/E)XK endonuclease
MNIDTIPDLELGKAAEHLVVADLILSGYRSYLTDQGVPYDVVLDDGGTLYRVQVKATRCVKRIPAHGAIGSGYLYNVRRAGKRGRRLYEDQAFDLLALVAMDLRIVAYLPLTGAVLQTIHLRAPGHAASPRTERTRTIDQFPVEMAVAVLAGKRPVLQPRAELIRIVPPKQETLFSMDAAS